MLMLLKEEIYVGGFKLINAKVFYVCLLACCAKKNLHLNANTSEEVTKSAHVTIKYAKYLESNSLEQWICDPILRISLSTIVV